MHLGSEAAAGPAPGNFARQLAYQLAVRRRVSDQVGVFLESGDPELGAVRVLQNVQRVVDGEVAVSVHGDETSEFTSGMESGEQSAEVAD